MLKVDRTWADARNFLCIRLDSLGDVLMTTPAIRALKEAHPKNKITLLTSPQGGRTAHLVPEVDRVIEYESPWMKSTPPRTDSKVDEKMIAKLKKAGFDAAVVFTVFSQNPLPAALMAFLADIPLRLAHCRENPYQLLTHWVPDPDPMDKGRHEVRRQLDLVAWVGFEAKKERLSIKVPAHAQRSLRKLLERGGLDLDCPWVVIHSGASAPSRRYPPEYFAEAADQLSHKLGGTVVFTGTRSELGLVKSIQETMEFPSISLAGQLSLSELAALIKSAPLLISNNSGPVHIAAAVGTPVVDLYALTNPQHTPWMVVNKVLNYDVPCKFCFKSICPEGHHDCLRKITPQEVVEAALELIKLLQTKKPASR
jgi:lipopolysaccharide heptosyltransferase II